MKIFMSSLSVLLLLSSCIREQQITKEEAIAAIQRFDRGWETKNMKLVDSVLARKYVYFTQSGSIFIRDSVVATAGQSGYALTHMDRSEFRVSISGNTAIVSTRWKGRGEYRGVPFDEDQRCSITVIKKNNLVSILAEHCTPIRINRRFH